MSRSLDGTAVIRDREWAEFPEFKGWIGLMGTDGIVEGAVVSYQPITVPQRGTLGESAAEIIDAKPSGINRAVVILTLRMIPHGTV